MNGKIITPKTRISELLEDFPELEKTLIEYAPAFTKLKNPLLRKTIAKITNLQQTSAIAGVQVEELINALRKEAGQEMAGIQDNAMYNETKPSWFDKEKVTSGLDAREMLERGEHPVNQVMAELKDLKAGEIYELKTPFLPAPLIDKASGLKYDHWVLKKSVNEFLVYFISETDKS